MTYIGNRLYDEPMAQVTTFDIFSAIGNPRRRQILDLLSGKEYGVMELADRLGISQPSVSEQLATLKKVELVKSSVRGRRHIYQLNPAPLAEVANWVITLDTFWGERFEQLGVLVEQLNKEEQDEQTI